MNVRVRFAPSPTGFLHVGGARTALFNYLFARRHGATFLLRIEDTDTERNRPEYEEEILGSMKWLGLSWSEKLVYQSQRFDLYREWVRKLLEKGEAYRCYCTPEEIEAMRTKAQAEGKTPRYDRRCRERTDHPDKPFAVRFKTPLSGSVTIDDLIKGPVTYDLKEFDDFIILRTNNVPIYNFTVAVDDLDMKISHVIRGEEHLNNTPKQLLVMKALGWESPRYAHLPLILAPDRTKLSKRHGAVGVTQYKREGYLREALVNYLVRLGWSPGDDREIFSLPELEQLFDLSGCGSSGAIFDRTKLDWYNAHYLKSKSPEELVTLANEALGEDYSALLQSAGGTKLLKAVVERATRLTDLSAQLSWYLSPQVVPNAENVEAVKKQLKPEAVGALKQALTDLPEGDFQSEKIGPLFKEVAAKIGGKMPDVAKPARILLTGTLASPDIALVVEALGKKRSLERLGASIFS